MELGRYRLKGRIAKGGMGEVYLAEDKNIGREVALKITEVDSRPRAVEEATRFFRREIQAIGMLNHPHILPLYDYGSARADDRSFLYIAMPYCKEKSLAVWWHKFNQSQPINP